MSTQAKISVAVVGLGFGAEFVPIYQAHPDVATVAICDCDAQRLQKVGDRFDIAERYTDVRDAAWRPTRTTRCTWSPGFPITPGRRSPCCNPASTAPRTVPMATSLADLQRVVQAQRAVRQELHDDGNGGLHAPVSLCPGTQGAGEHLAASSSCAGPTTRTWSAGRRIGPVCRRCGMPPMP